MIAPLVHVVDDDAALRASTVFLAESVGWSARGYADADTFLQTATTAGPGCAILDVRMPVMSGLELQREMLVRGVDLPVIFVTGHGDVALAVQAMKAGAIDFLEKPFRDQALLDSIAKAVRASVARATASEEHDALGLRVARLTPRERDVAQLVAQGLPNKAIAFALAISEKTVHVHRSRVMEKTQTRSAAELARLMMRIDPQLVDASVR